VEALRCHPPNDPPASVDFAATDPPPGEVDAPEDNGLTPWLVNPFSGPDVTLDATGIAAAVETLAVDGSAPTINPHANKADVATQQARRSRFNRDAISALSDLVKINASLCLVVGAGRI
jgi:hypothetical protein